MKYEYLSAWEPGEFTVFVASKEATSSASYIMISWKTKKQNVLEMLNRSIEVFVKTKRCFVFTKTSIDLFNIQQIIVMENFTLYNHNPMSCIWRSSGTVAQNCWFRCASMFTAPTDTKSIDITCKTTTYETTTTLYVHVGSSSTKKCLAARFYRIEWSRDDKSTQMVCTSGE